jgi:hypothetical protein
MFLAPSPALSQSVEIEFCRDLSNWVCVGATATFSTADPAIWALVSVSGEGPYELKIEWVAPNGTVYSTRSSQASGSGPWMFRSGLEVRGRCPEALPGQWTLRVAVNNRPVGSARFTLRSSGEGAAGTPAVWFLGFSVKSRPADSLQFRQALAYGIDRDAVARAASPVAFIPGAQAAGSIQPPRVPGYNAAVRGQTYDPAKAKELYGQSAWTGPIRILTSTSTSPWNTAIQTALAESLSRAMGASVTYDRVANLSTLTRAGDASIWLTGWLAERGDFGYPSVAMGIANAYFLSDPEVGALVERKAVLELEQVLLDKALIVPMFFYTDCRR